MLTLIKKNYFWNQFKKTITMKKIINSVLIITVILTAFAFTNPTKEKVPIKESTIIWEGKKITGSSHSGTVALKEGYFEIENDLFVGGKFVIDMTSITNTDIESEESKLKLENHLKSEDFFGVNEFPTATLVIDGVEQLEEAKHFKVHSTLTIKGISNPVDFKISAEDRVATVHLEIDRSKFNVRYGSGSFFDNLGNRAISDMMSLDITLKY